jgi:hypothetical protein
MAVCCQPGNEDQGLEKINHKFFVKVAKVTWSLLFCEEDHVLRNNDEPMIALRVLCVKS